MIAPSGVLRDARDSNAARLEIKSERFPAKWMPVRVKKTRQNKEIEPPFRFNRNGKGSSAAKKRGASVGSASFLLGSDFDRKPVNRL
jgi:hypothetical protein